MNQKKLPVVSIIFFILAGVLLALGIWGAIYASNYISSLIDAGQLMVDGNEYELVSFHLSSYGQYVFFAIIIFGIGWIVYLLAPEEEEFVLEEELFLEDEEEPVIEESLVEEVLVDPIEEIDEEDIAEL